MKQKGRRGVGGAVRKPPANLREDAGWDWSSTSIGGHAKESTNAGSKTAHPQTEEEMVDPQSSTLTKEPASKPLLPATLVLDT